MAPLTASPSMVRILPCSGAASEDPYRRIERCSPRSKARPVPSSKSDSEGQAAAARPGLGPILLTLFIDLVGFSIIFPLFPAILDSYRGDPWLEGWLDALRSLSPQIDEPRLVVLFGGVLGSIYSFLQFLLSPFWGSLSDRIGRRPVLLITIWGNLMAALLWAFSGNFALLVLSRVLAGIAGGNISAATAAVADLTPGPERARGMGLIGASFGLGFILGPAIGGALSLIDMTPLWPAEEGGALLATSSFTAAALGVCLLSAINWLWVWLRLKETRPAGFPPRPLRWQISLGGHWGHQVRRVQLANLIYLIGFSGMEFTLAFLVQQRFSWQSTDIAVMFVSIGLVLALVQGGLSRPLARRWGPHATSLSGFCLVIVGLMGIAIATLEWQLWLSLIPLSVGAAMVMPMLSTIVSESVGPLEQGEVLGSFRSLGSLARAIGPIFAAILYWQVGPSAPYWVSAAILIIPIGLISGGLVRK
ncbi:MAG TPA: MFS transporter [Planctomycetes bacterium]|nr:MFS transporter [Planctomycetota bacterium]HIK82560.1 MFS transporter [Planctomycetota bacterium]